MANVFDVSAYILYKLGAVTHMKLQKLVYYSQAWSLVWDEEPIYPESIQAWANGPVVPELYRRHQGKFTVGPQDEPGGLGTLNSKELATIDAVLQHYGDKSAQWLSQLTHQEDPWKDARKGLAPGERGSSIISHSAMIEYYSSL